MNGNHFFTETLYGFKRSRRNVIFGIFVFLGGVGIILYMFTPLSNLGSVKNLEELFQGMTMDWFSRSLPSSIPFKCAYLFNILQLFFGVALVMNDVRLFRLDSTEALSVHSQGNLEITAGNVVGKILALTVANVSIFAICALLNLLFYPEVFNVGYYLFYWSTLNLPATVFCVGLSTCVMRVVKNQGLCVIFLALIFGVLTLPGSVWLNGLFDPLASRIPNMFSDFMGHVNLWNYLLQRAAILLFGVGFVILSAVAYFRIHNHPKASFRLFYVALLPLLVAGTLVTVYACGIQSVFQKRETFRKVYAKYDREEILKITANHLCLKEMANGGISVTSKMTVENRDSVVLPLVFYLNPALAVSAVVVDGEEVLFQREQQVILADKSVAPGEIREVVVKYEGKIDNSFCFLDTPEEKYASLNVNTNGIFRYGNSPAFCEKKYKLLSPECGWYPVCEPPYHSFGFRSAMFTRYALEVEHDPRLVAISQGMVDRETVGKTTFRFEHAMPGISLCIGDYKKREMLVCNDTLKYLPSVPNEFMKNEYPVKVEFFYLPAHEFMVDFYNTLSPKRFTDAIENVKKEMGFYGGYYYYGLQRVGGKIVNDLTLQYPYSWLTLVETPCHFHAYQGKMLQAGERVQGGMVFWPERRYSIYEAIDSYKDEKVEMPAEMESMLKSLGVDTSPYFDDGKGLGLYRHLQDVLRSLTKGECNLQSSCVGNTSFLHSDKYPLIGDVLKIMFYNFYPEPSWAKFDYFVVDYLKNHSLEDALHDPSLSSDWRDKIIRKKCDELLVLLDIQIGKMAFLEFYHDFLRANLFEGKEFEEFSRECFARFGIDLDTIVDNWYRSNKLPAFQIAGHTISLQEGLIYEFKVFNRGEVPGIISLSGKEPGWIIPPGEGLDIRKYVKNAANNNVRTLLALNLPQDIELPCEKGNENTDTTGWFLPLEDFVFPTNMHEIIVDDEDAGFSIQETGKRGIASLLGKVETKEKCYVSPPETYWGFRIKEDCQGTFVRGAYFKKAGLGNQRVHWATRLPREGKYEVFCYLPNEIKHKSFVANIYDERTYHYTVFDGKEEREVELSLNGKDWGWISLGVFDFCSMARVTLSDRDRIYTPENENLGPQVVVADAVKWVEVGE